MVEVFNKKKINDFICLIKHRYFVQLTQNDIIYKQYKRIPFEHIRYVKTIFTFSKNKKEIMSRFFPVKYREISSNGDFEIINFCYNSSDEKIHCIVEQNGNERHFKLKTDDYINRIRNEVDQFKDFFVKEISKFFGFWLVDNKYITDMSHTKDGGYRHILDLDDYEDKSSAFGDILSVADLYKKY